MPSSLRRRLCLGVAGALAAVGTPMLARGAPLTLRYPRPESGWDERDRYPLQLLTAALMRTGQAFELRPSRTDMLQGRALRELERGGDVDVVWAMTSVEYERRLLPVRIPIFRGLIGWRLPLVLRRRLEVFARVRGVDDLRRLTAAQGHDWPDLQILRSNGLPVQAVHRYESLFRMLVAGRYDYFPRSVAEIWAEAAAYEDTGIVVEPTLAIHYPAAFYFFVNKGRADLHQMMLQGLESMLADGSFATLFDDHYGALLQMARLAGRQVIELRNPILPPETPLGRSQLWYRPGE